MISNPELYIETFAKSGADIITVHVEATNHLDAVIRQIKKSGKKAGVSLNPSTPLCSIEYVLPYVDIVLIMSVNPGFGGQEFISTSVDKIEKLKEMIVKNNCNALIRIDGGINTYNSKNIVYAGADILVPGSVIFTSDNASETIKKLKG